MTQRIIGTGKRRISISNYGEKGPFHSRLWVNCTAPRYENDASALGDATLTKAKHKTLAGAIGWADDILTDGPEPSFVSGGV